MPGWLYVIRMMPCSMLSVLQDVTPFPDALLFVSHNLQQLPSEIMQPPTFLQPCLTLCCSRARRCHGLVRVNVYKDAVKNTGFPTMPHMRKLTASLTAPHAALQAAASLAADRPVHMVSPEEESAARLFLSTVHEYLAGMCGDLRLHTIINVGMSKRTGWLMKDSLIEGFPAKDRPFIRAFAETQMFAVYSDIVISDYCES